MLLHIILEDGFICVLHYMMLGPALARPDNAFTSGTIPRLTLRKHGPLVREQWLSKELSCVLTATLGPQPTSSLCWTFDPFRSFPSEPERRPSARPDLDTPPVHGDGGHLAQPPAQGPDVGHHRAQSWQSFSQWDSSYGLLSQPITNEKVGLLRISDMSWQRSWPALNPTKIWLPIPIVSVKAHDSHNCTNLLIVLRTLQTLFQNWTY